MVLTAPLTLALVLVSGQAWRASTAPGPSSRAHEAVSGNCDACHMPFKGLPNEKCLTCHTGLKKFHASVAAQKCNACHAEHKGPAGDLTKPTARQSFDHALTGMPLIGAHAKVKCESCHDKPIEKMTQTCSGCHKDVHQGTLGSSCQSCHRSDVWKPVLHGRDEHKVSLKDGHAKNQCVDCHKEGKNLAAVVPCASCHERAHGGTTAPCDGCHKVSGWKPAEFDHSFCTCILPQLHQTVGCLGCHPGWNFTKTPLVCSGCHEKERKHEPLGECSLCHSAVSWKKNRFEHNKRSKFKLTGQHLAVSCENCHLPSAKKGGGESGVAPKAARSRPEEMKFRGIALQCEGCHQKQGDEAHGNFGPCAKCHTPDGFKPSKFDHATTGFPLVGRHATLNCKACHAEKTKGYPVPKKAELPGGSLRGALAWAAGTMSDAMVLTVAVHPAGKEATCSHCHADPHQGSVKEFGECSSCHGNDAWKPSSFDVTRHASTAFPLTGKHASAKCKLCHTELKLDEAPKECAKCHVDRHGGRLGTTCEKCHNTTAFKPASGFDHAMTGFALKGAHATVSCASCHDGSRGKAMAASKTPAACTTCHAPQHGKLGEQCSDCHDPEKGPFAKARGMSFPHQTTGFPLERRHATLRCGACHVAAAPPPSQRCASCHDDPHRGALGQGCEDCHQPDRWRVTRFDHDRTGWPLQGRHFTTPCMSCHTAQRWVGLTTECWDCHMADAARGQAAVPASHPVGRIDCHDCHMSMWRWRPAR